MTDDAATVARVRGLLTEVGDVVGGDADSVIVRVGRTRASIRVVDIAENLEVLSVTQLIAVNLPNIPQLRDDVDTHDAKLSFGSLRRSDPEGVTTDVLLYYTFPIGGLADMALLTMLHLVLVTGADVADHLVGGAVS
ncbi:hypothetical protein EF294_09085 [Gordonia oryzae]|uniref:YbjN domain-containing protein n=1 Tax=Gordonia oryzae TaxID=2487349 RepID=A0A3N4GU76_9ACTN|nr:hypothetical protein [Gordonia oryzae]RPA62170.1 hypothetical protein EF294_09085 [Gordonia oryzae]